MIESPIFWFWSAALSSNRIVIFQIEIPQEIMMMVITKISGGSALLQFLDPSNS